MVLLTRILGYAAKVQRKAKREGFIDSLRLHVTGGTGGAGLPQYGGLGGAGGNVNVVLKDGTTLRNVKYKLKGMKLKAEVGNDSSRRGLIGEPGKDLDLDVPNGIVVYDENRIKLGEINPKNPKVMIAKGGRGGCESTGFCGLRGESRTIVLDLQLIADVGLIGFPNAGKSTFLNAVSMAKPKIASYPFTTIKPQIGIMTYTDQREISVADLPGLIEGAHMNRGMGHRFLKHVERTKLLLFIVDIQGCQVSDKYDHRSCLETILLLNKEIELYKPDLLERPAILVVNKMDTEGAEEIYNEIKPKLCNLADYLLEFDVNMKPKKLLNFNDIIAASLMSKKMEELQDIKDKIRHAIDKYEEEKLFSKNEEDDNQQLYQRLRHQLEPQAPTFV